MRTSTIGFFFVLVVIVLLIARYNSRSRFSAEQERNRAPISQLVPTPTISSSLSNASPFPQNKERSIDFSKIAARIQPAVVLVSVFEPSGKLLRTGSGL